MSGLLDRAVAFCFLLLTPKYLWITDHLFLNSADKTQGCIKHSKVKPKNLAQLHKASILGKAFLKAKSLARGCGNGKVIAVNY